MQKRGELSKLGIIFLIGSLIVVLGIVAWIVFQGGKENQNTFEDSTLDLKISEVKKVDENTLGITIKRNSGEGDFVGLSFAVNDGTITEIIRVNSSIPENQDGNFSLKFIVLNASKIKKISVSPIFIDEEGKEVIGNIKDEYVTPNTCSNYCPADAQCGVNGCGMNCGNGCSPNYLCLNYKCIKQQSSSGGGGGGSSSDDESSDDEIIDNENETVCVPTTCSALSRTCGTVSNGCTGTLNCGICSTGYICQYNGTCIKEVLIDCGDVSCKSGEYCSNGVCLLTVPGDTYFVALNGNDNNPGTFEQPWGTWKKAFDTADAGDIVYFREGIWYPTEHIDYTPESGNSGTESEHIIYANYPGETPILDLNEYNYINLASLSGLAIHYITNIELRGLTIRNNKQDVPGQWISGLELYQCGNIWLDRITSYGHGGYGIWIIGYDNLYLTNSDSYDNIDYISDDPGNRADGFTIGGGGRENTYTYISGCRSWNNSDDGFEISSSGELEVYDLWSFYNGRLEYGGGVPYHLGPAHETNPDKRKIHNVIAASSDGDAFTENNLLVELKGPVASYANNFAYRCNMGFTSSPNVFDCSTGYANVTYRNNIVYQSTYGVVNDNYPSYYDQAYLAACDYNFPIYATGKNNTWIFSMAHSYWDYNPAFNVTDEDFVSLDVNQLLSPRNFDGSLAKNITFGHLAQGSDLIDGGIVIPGYHCSTAGYQEGCSVWYGSAPDLGVFESNY